MPSSAAGDSDRGLPDDPAVALLAVAQRLLDQAPFAYVAGDRGGAITSPLVPRIGEMVTEAWTRLPSLRTDRLVVLDALPAREAGEDARKLVGAVRRHDDRDRAADHLGAGVAVETLRRRVPAGDGAVERLADDGVVRALDDGRELRELGLAPIVLTLQQALAALHAVDEERGDHAGEAEAEQRRPAGGLAVDPTQDRIDGREENADSGGQSPGPRPANQAAASTTMKGRRKGTRSR